MKTILITGINGFLGSHLAKCLSDNNQIIGLEYSTENLFRLKKDEFKVYSSELDNLKTIFEENNIDFVVHTATTYRVFNNSIESMLKTNVLLPIKLYELANHFGAEAFLNTDSFFNDPNSNYSYLGDYTLTKRCCVDFLKSIQNQTKIINMKLFHMYGPSDSPDKFVSFIMNELKSNKPLIKLTKGDQMRDFIFVEDVVNAFKLIINSTESLEEKFTEFEIGTGKSVSIKDFVCLTSKLLGSKSKLDFGALKHRGGEIMFSQAKNDSILSLGWKINYDLEKGINQII